MKAFDLAGSTSGSDMASQLSQVDQGVFWNQVLAVNVRHFRRLKNVSQESLAEECGIFRTYLSRIENGSANPSLTVLVTLAAALGITPHALLTPMD